MFQNIAMEEVKKNLPNALTIFRVILAFACTYFAFKHDKWSLSISLGIFLLASFTDFLDGFLARRWKTESNFGKITDPIADKLLILGVLISFSMRDIVPFLFTAIIAFREILLTVVRLLLAPKKIVIAAAPSGKFKTFSQIICLILIYMILIFIKPLRASWGQKNVNYIIYFLIFWMVIVTVYSGIEFFILNRRKIWDSI